MSESPPTTSHSPLAAAAYRSLSPWAVLSLILGGASFLAMFSSLLAILPLGATLAAVVALRTIARQQGELGGRRLALGGLTLGVAFAAAVAAESFFSPRLLTAEARPLVDSWFRYLRQGHSHYAHQLLAPKFARQPLDAELWNFYRQDAAEAEKLRRFVNEPYARALLAAGPRIQWRYWKTNWAEEKGPATWLALTYAVTVDDGQGRKTFFLNFLLQRLKDPSAERWDWNIYSVAVDPAPGGARP